MRDFLAAHLPVGLAVALATALAAPAAAAEPLSFIALGDLPYPDDRAPPEKKFWQHGLFTKKLAPAIRAAAAPFVVHLGDFKGGGESCDDALIAKRRDEIMGLHDGPVFYTPGDNDWTDCDRAFLERPMSELERLSHLREQFFATPPRLGDDWAYARQPNYPENARWRQGEVFFATLHLVGTNNGRAEVLRDDVELAWARVEAREHANRLWLDALFDVAGKAEAKAVVIATQVDLAEPDAGGPCTLTNRAHCAAFAGVRAQLVARAADFGEPVLLMHGDTFPYCLDKGFGGRAAPKLWRLNAAGDFKVIDAVRVTVDPENAGTPFAMETLLEGEAPEAC